MDDLSQFIGFEELGPTRSKRLLTCLSHNLPPSHLSRTRLALIVYVNQLRPEDDSNKRFRRGECHIPEEWPRDPANIIVYKCSPVTLPAIRELALIEHVVYHEVAHVAFLDLPPRDRQDWTSIVQREDISSSIFPADPRLSPEEEFAECYAHYVQQSDVLKDISMEKYAFLRTRLFRGREYQDRSNPIPSGTMVFDVSDEILPLVRRNPEIAHTLGPEAFEGLVVACLRDMGFIVMRTGSTYATDGGIDFVAMPKGLTVGSYLLAGQVKYHYEDKKTGRDAVDRLLAWKDSDFRIGLLVSNTGFTAPALWLAMQPRNKSFLRLRDFQDLKRWLNGNLCCGDEFREIPDQIELAPGVVIDVPKPGPLDVRRTALTAGRRPEFLIQVHVVGDRRIIAEISCPQESPPKLIHCDPQYRTGLERVLATLQTTPLPIMESRMPAPNDD